MYVFFSGCVMAPFFKKEQIRLNDLFWNNTSWQLSYLRVLHFGKKRWKHQTQLGCYFQRPKNKKLYQTVVFKEKKTTFEKFEQTLAFRWGVVLLGSCCIKVAIFAIFGCILALIYRVRCVFVILTTKIVFGVVNVTSAFRLE